MFPARRAAANQLFTPHAEHRTGTWGRASARPGGSGRRRSAGGLRRRSGAVLTSLVALAATGLAAGPVAVPALAQGGAKTVKAGEIILTDPTRGEMKVVGVDGKPRLLDDGLVAPHGLGVLQREDTILIAERTENRISGWGGPYGENAVPVADIIEPEGIAVTPDDSVFVTGRATPDAPSRALIRVDIAGHTKQVVAEGFSASVGVAVHGGKVYVADAGKGELVEVSPVTLEKRVIAANLGQPTGLAAGPDGEIFVADFGGGRILKVEPPQGDQFGVVSEIARVDGPRYLSLVPAVPRPNTAFSLMVVFRDGVQEFDSNGTILGRALNSDPGGVFGIATFPGEPKSDPVIAPVDPSVPSSVLDPETTTTTRAGQTSTEPESSGSAGLALVGGLLVLLVGGGIAAFVLFTRREGGVTFDNDLGDFGEIDSGVTLANAVGPCAAIEARMAEVEQAVRGVQEQRVSADRRRREAIEQTEIATAREEAARIALADTRAKLAAEAKARDAAGTTEATDTRVSLDDLNLQTEEGWAALRAFGKKEISAVELRKRWEGLGEKDAIAAVLGSGQAMKPEERAAVEELDAAKEERLHAERDAKEAQADLERLDEREVLVTKQREEMRRALADCRKDQKRDELQAATDAKEAFQEAEEAATMAALALRIEDFGEGAVAADVGDVASKPPPPGAKDGSAAASKEVSKDAPKPPPPGAKAASSDVPKPPPPGAASKEESKGGSTDVPKPPPPGAKAASSDAPKPPPPGAASKDESKGGSTDVPKPPPPGAASKDESKGGSTDVPKPPPPGAPTAPTGGASTPPPAPAGPKPPPGPLDSGDALAAVAERTASPSPKADAAGTAPSGPPPSSSAAPTSVPPAPPAPPVAPAGGTTPPAPTPVTTGPVPTDADGDDPSVKAAQDAAKRAVAKALADAARAKGAPAGEEPAPEPEAAPAPKRSIFGRKPKD